MKLTFKFNKNIKKTRNYDLDPKIRQMIHPNRLKHKYKNENEKF